MSTYETIEKPGFNNKPGLIDFIVVGFIILGMIMAFGWVVDYQWTKHEERIQHRLENLEGYVYVREELWERTVEQSKKYKEMTKE